MNKYDITDYMPQNASKVESGKDPEVVSETPESAEAAVVDGTEDIEEEPRVMEPLDMTPEQLPVSPKEPNAEPIPGWSRFVSALFSPLLMTTYTVALMMWITPLSELPERPRFGATLMIFLITAVAPMSYILTLLRMGHIGSVDIPKRKNRFSPAIISLICLGLGVLYLSYVHAPKWLVVIPGVFGISTITFILLNFRHMVSGHAVNISTLAGILLYLGINVHIDVTVSRLVAVAILLTGLVCSARIAAGRHNLVDVTLGAAVGFVVGFGAMYILHF